MAKHEGNPDCSHDWVYDSKVVATNPPVYTKICKKCGRVEEERGSYSDAMEFDRIHDKFYGGGGGGEGG